MELKQKIFNILKESTLGSLGTISLYNKPWVRYMAFKVSEDLTIRAATRLNSRKVKEIQKNPQVHLLCGLKDFNAWTSYLQIQGNAIISTDAQEKNGYWTSFLKKYFKDKEDPNYAIIRIKPYCIEYTSAEGEIKVWKPDHS